ncbi:MAG: hypothetical protein APR54_10285, partial [Candidatus Cloacimonas sp. SDB]
MKKSVLIVSYYTYPCDLIGAKRSSYLANYLHSQNFRVIVLKAANKHYGTNVDYTLKLNKNIEIKHIKYRWDLVNFKLSIRWYFLFKKELIAILRENHVDQIIMSGGPFCYFNLTGYLKKKTNANIILDFRDLWAFGFLRPKGFRNRIIYKIKQILEKNSISSADIVIGVSEKISEKYKKLYSTSTKADFITIMNGFDESLLENMPFTKKNQESFKLAIFGKFSSYNLNDVKVLVNGLSSYKNEFKLIHIGLQELYLEKMIKVNQLEKQFIYLGYMNYVEAMSKLSEMDCLIVNNRLEVGIGTKIFDYIYLNKPILAFLKNCGEHRAFLQQ